MSGKVLTHHQKVSQLLDRVIDTDNQTLITAYEARINDLEDRRLVLKEKIVKCGTVCQILTKPIEPLLNFLKTRVVYGFQIG